jgi:hypothetical protein
MSWSSSLVARPEHDRVVRDLRVFAFSPEIPDKKAHRVPLSIDARVRPALAVLGRDEVAVRPRRVGVGDDDVGLDALTVREQHAARALALDEDLLHLGPAAHGAALAFDQRYEAVHQRAGTADGKVHAPVALEEGDERVDRRRRERVPADEERVKAQHLAEPVVLHVARHHAVDGAVAAELDHLRDDLRHVHPRAEGHVAQLLEADAKDLLALRDEALVPGHVAGLEFADLAAHFGGVAGVIKLLTVGKPDPVERRHRPHVDGVRHALAAQRPQLLEEERRGDHGGPGVEGEPVLLVHVSSPAGGIELVQHGHAVAAGAEAHRRGEPAKAAADHDGMSLRARGRAARHAGSVMAVHGLTNLLHVDKINVYRVNSRTPKVAV